MVFCAFTGIQLEKKFFLTGKIFFSNWLRDKVAKILVKQFQLLFFTELSYLFYHYQFSAFLSAQWSKPSIQLFF